MTGVIRVMTWNVHGFRDARGAPSLERVADAIRAVDAHVVALQECTWDAPPRRPDAVPESVAAQTLAMRTGLQVALGACRPQAGGCFGNALLTRTALVDVRRVALPDLGGEPRGMLVARTQLSGQPWQILATHLGLSWRARALQTRALVAQASRYAGPSLVLGDFNTWLRWEPAVRQLDRDLALSAAPPSFPAAYPVLALDRVYLRNASVRVARVPVPRNQDVWLSDHRPVAVELVHGPNRRQDFGSSGCVRRRTGQVQES